VFVLAGIARFGEPTVPKLVQLRKADAPITLRPEGRISSVRPVQFWKALGDIVVTVAGMVKVPVRFAQFSKPPISVKPEPTDNRPLKVVFMKARGLMDGLLVTDCLFGETVLWLPGSP